jgi:sulfur carrier protein
MNDLTPAEPASPPGASLRLTVNGESRTFAPPLTCAGLIEVLALGGRRIAFERNGEIVPRSRLGDTLLCDADTIEIVVAVGGG